MSSSGESMTKLSYLVRMGMRADFLTKESQGSWSIKWKSLDWSMVSLSVRLAT